MFCSFGYYKQKLCKDRKEEISTLLQAVLKKI